MHDIKGTTKAKGKSIKIIMIKQATQFGVVFLIVYGTVRKNRKEK